MFRKLWYLPFLIIAIAVITSCAAAYHGPVEQSPHLTADQMSQALAYLDSTSGDDKLVPGGGFNPWKRGLILSTTYHPGSLSLSILRPNGNIVVRRSDSGDANALYSMIAAGDYVFFHGDDRLTAGGVEVRQAQAIQVGN